MMDRFKVSSLGMRPRVPDSGCKRKCNDEVRRSPTAPRGISHHRSSPETGLDRWWEMPRGAVGDRRTSSLHFLLQPESGTRGRMPREETLKRSIIAALMAAAAPLAFAQSPEEPAVVVTATRFPESRLEAPIGMTVISAKQIGESAAKTLPQLLSQEAGILTRDNTGGPDWQIDMRGFGITG